MDERDRSWIATSAGAAPGGCVLTSLDGAVAWIDAQIEALGSDVTAVAAAIGRVLAAPVAADADIPSTDRSAIEGIAVRAEDSVGASPYNPLGFRLRPAFETFQALSAMRVGAGEALPDGADAVVPLEHVSLDAAGRCEIVDAIAAGSHVERRGSAAARGASLLPAGRRLRPSDIAALIEAGIASVPTIRRPEIRVLRTAPRARLARPGAAGDAHGPLLTALVERDGGARPQLRTVARERTALCDALAEPGSDLVLVVGATGNGDDDVAPAALAAAGELAVRGLAMIPGETAGLGRTVGGKPVVLLPRALPACLWAYELLAGRAIRRLAGRDLALPFPSRDMRLCRKISSAIGLTEIRPVRARADGAVEPMLSFADAGLTAATRADGFVIVPEGSEGLREGASVRVYLFEEPGVSSPYQTQRTP
jgi:molybdopterin molybdotransferase